MPSLSEETNGRIERLMPGATIGIIGGGQLGRMMALSARYMGFRIGVLDPTPDCPTAQVADFQVTAEYDDIAAIRELAEKSDVLTYEFENVDADAIDQVRSLAAAPAKGTDYGSTCASRRTVSTRSGSSTTMARPPRRGRLSTASRNLKRHLMRSTIRLCSENPFRRLRRPRPDRAQVRSRLGAGARPRRP